MYFNLTLNLHYAVLEKNFNIHIHIYLFKE